MPRVMSEASEREFAELGAFIRFFSTHVVGIPETDPVHPANVLGQSVALFGKSKALAGLRQAIHDDIEMSAHQTPEWVARLDAECRSRGIVTLSQLRSRYWAKYKAVLRRSRIRTETEYYLLMGILNDVACSVPRPEREKIGSLVSAYEDTVAQQRAAGDAAKRRP